MNYHNRQKASRLYSIQIDSKGSWSSACLTVTQSNMWKDGEDSDWPIKQGLAERAIIDRQNRQVPQRCCIQVHLTVSSGKPPQRFHRLPLEVRDMKRVPRSATAKIMTFKRQFDKYLSCVPDEPLISEHPTLAVKATLYSISLPAAKCGCNMQMVMPQHKKLVSTQLLVSWQLRFDLLYSKIRSFLVSELPVQVEAILTCHTAMKRFCGVLQPTT